MSAIASPPFTASTLAQRKTLGKTGSEGQGAGGRGQGAGGRGQGAGAGAGGGGQGAGDRGQGTGSRPDIGCHMTEGEKGHGEDIDSV